MTEKSRLIPVFEAAKLIETVTGEPAKEVESEIRESWQYGETLPLYNLRGRRLSPGIGDAYDSVDWEREGLGDFYAGEKDWRVDINELMNQRRYHTEIQAAILAELAKAQNAPKKKPASEGASWKEQARNIADELDQRDCACGAYDGLRNLADRISSVMRERSIHGPRGPLSGNTILREALQGGKWNRKRP